MCQFLKADIRLQRTNTRSIILSSLNDAFTIADVDLLPHLSHPTTLNPGHVTGPATRTVDLVHTVF